MRKLMLILLILLLALPALAQGDRATIRFAWTQPAFTQGGQPTQNGWLKEYDIFLAAGGDTVFYGVAPAPVAVADSAQAYVNLVIGEPSAIRVRARDKWDQVGPFSEWSDVTVVIPEPPIAPGRPAAIR